MIYFNTRLYLVDYKDFKTSAQIYHNYPLLLDYYLIVSWQPIEKLEKY